MQDLPWYDILKQIYLTAYELVSEAYRRWLSSLLKSNSEGYVELPKQKTILLHVGVQSEAVRSDA